MSAAITVPQFSPLIQGAVRSTISGMAMTPAELAQEPYEKKGTATFGQVTGVIGLASKQLHASLAISFQSPCILDVFSNMLGETLPEVTDDVLDAVGEITNVLCGDLKRQLSEQTSLEIEMATPLVISGSDVRIRDRVTRKTWVFLFRTAKGDFVVETNLAQ